MSTLEMKTDIDEMMMMESTSQQMKLETKAGDDEVPGSTTRKGPPPQCPTRGTSQGKEILSSFGAETDKNPPAKATTNACVLPSSAAQQMMPLKSKPPPHTCANNDNEKNVSISTPGRDSSATISLKLKLPFGKTNADQESDQKPASPAIRRGEEQHSMTLSGSLFGGATKSPGGFAPTGMPEGDGERSRSESSKAPEGEGRKTARKMGETHPTEPTAKAAPMIFADMGKMKAKENLAASAPVGKINTHKGNTKSDRDSGAPATANPSLWGTLNYQAPTTKPLPPGIADDAWVDLPNSIYHTQTSFNQCKICMEPLMSPTIAPNELPVSLNACGHIFHQHCLREALKHQSSLRCPECSGLLLSGKDCLPYLRGKMPSGSLTWLRVASVSCAGFEGCGCIRLNYAIPSSIQKSYHLNPGEHHGSAHRTAYLPDNYEGRELFSRLQVAFLCGLTFSVGTSLTTGRDNAVTWGSLHHKTSTSGGIGCHGYPDESYLSNCNAELDAAGVPNSVICSEHVRQHEYNNLKFWQGDSMPAPASQLLLFHLIHAKHCISAGPCPVVSGCSRFKALNQHVQHCTNRGCDFNDCKEAKAVLAHFDKKSPRCQGCGICGILPSAIKGAENISKNFAELRYQDLSDYTRLANLKLPTNRFEATFFYEQNVRDVFASPSSNLFDVLSKVNSSELPKFLEQNGVPNTVVEMNPHISIESFVPHISIESFVEEGIKCCAQDQDLHVRIVFHGTPEINVESILRRGLDQSKRKRQLYGPGEYFSSCPAISIQNYCRGGQRVIVFAVIAGNADIRTREIVVVEKPQRQLPIATLHFANNCQISKVNQSKPSPRTSDQDANDRNKRGRLLLLRHASKCTAKNGQCTVTPHCAEMKAVWKHIANCKDSYCNFPHCMSSRYTLSHWRKCKPPCNICDPLRQMIKNADMNQINSHLAVKGDDGSGAGSGSMGMGGGGMAKCTPAPTPVSQPPDQPPNKRQRRDPAP